MTLGSSSSSRTRGGTSRTPGSSGGHIGGDGLRDCLQPVEPLEYESDQRAWPCGSVLTGEIFDPSGEGGIFIGSEHRDIVGGRGWQQRAENDYFREFRILAWFGDRDRRAALAASAARRGTFLLPPLRVQRWGRIEMIQRPYRLNEDGTRKDRFGPEMSAGGPDVKSGDQAPLYVIGVQNPYHALVDLHDDGSFRLEGVPAGTYWLRTFDAHFATVRQEVTVDPGQLAEVEIVLDRLKD